MGYPEPPERSPKLAPTITYPGISPIPLIVYLARALNKKLPRRAVTGAVSGVFLASEFGRAPIWTQDQTKSPLMSAVVL